MNNRLLIILLAVAPIIAHAQAGYKIAFKLQGLSDTTVYLGYFLQEKTFIRDTATVDSRGSFVFDGTPELAQGIYFLVLDKTRIVDFVVGEDQQFTLSTSTADYVGNMKVDGDIDNKVFFDNMKFGTELGREAEPLTAILQDSTRNDDEKQSARDHLQKINERAHAFQDDIIVKHPNTLTARLLKMNKPVEIPDPPKKPDGSIDSTFQLRYYRAHYFDNLDLADPAMLRVPKVFYWDKVQDYLTRLYVQHPDTIASALNSLIAKAKTNRETYRYLVWNAVVNYFNPEIMGLDQVFVQLVDRYITSGEMDYWIDKKTVQNLKDEADKRRRAKIGSIAPDLIMQDQDLQRRALYDFKTRYTIIFFFKPTCSHCREETPKLVDFYNANRSKYDLGVFAVATDTSMREMREFIKQFKTPWTTVNGPRSYLNTHFSNLYYADQTPMVYILDKDKKIIARKIPVEQIGEFLENYDRFHKKGSG